MKSQQQIEKTIRGLKTVLIIFLMLALLSNAVFLVANLLQSTALENGVPPKIPFLEGTSFCSLGQNVYKTDFEKGTILLIKNQPTYEKGDKVLVDQSLTPTKEFSIDEKYDVGVISEATDTGYKMLLLSYDNKSVELESTDVIGRISTRVLFVGHIYNNILGARGYILFGVIPILFLALLFFIMRYFAVSLKVQSENNHQATEQRPQESQVEARPQPKQRAHAKQQVSVQTQTIRSVTKPKLTDLIEAEQDVKLYCEATNQAESKSNIIQAEVESVNATVDYQPTQSNHTKRKNIDISLGNEETIAQNPLKQHSTSQTEAQHKRDMFQRITDNNSAIIMQKISSEIEVLIKEEEDELDFARINSNYQEKAERIEKSTRPIKLSADQIIALYREENEKHENQSDEDDAMAAITKMYYDSDIDSFKE